MEGKNGGGYIPKDAREKEKLLSFAFVVDLYTGPGHVHACWPTGYTDSIHNLCNLCIVR